MNATINWTLPGNTLVSNAGGLALWQKDVGSATPGFSAAHRAPQHPANALADGAPPQQHG